MIFAICKYFLPFDGRPWHRFEWLAHSDMGLTAKWLCQPGKCFQLPHPSPPKKNIYPNEHSRVSNIGVVARAVRVCMRNPNNGPHIGNQSVYDLKNKSTWGQICVIVYSCLYIYKMWYRCWFGFLRVIPTNLKACVSDILSGIFSTYFWHIIWHAVAQGAFFEGVQCSSNIPCLLTQHCQWKMLFIEPSPTKCKGTC